MSKNIFRAGLGVLATLVLASTAFAGSTNLLVNASFEDPMLAPGAETQAAPGWGVFGSVFTLYEQAGGATLQAHDGVQYMKTFGVGGVTQQFAVNPDDTVTASAWVFNDSNDIMGIGQVAAVNIEWFLADGVTAVMAGPDAIVSFGSAITGDTSLFPVDTWLEIGVFGATVPTGDNGTAAVAQITIITGPFAGVGGGAPKFDDAFFGIESAVVPIPGALLLMGPALLGLMGFRRKSAA